MSPIGSTRALLGCAAAYHFRHALIARCAPRALTAAGIRRVAFVRHGNTAPSPDGVDFERLLTDAGREQSRMAGASYGAARLPPFHPLALCSPAPRCVETAEIFLRAALDGRGAKERISTTTTRAAGPELYLVPGLYDGTMQPEGSRLFSLIGYSALRDYVENPDDDDRQAALDVLGAYANVALEAICKYADKKVEGGDKRAAAEPETTLLFFAHAIYLPSAALGLAEICDCSQTSIDLLLSTDTQEAEGYLIDLLDKEVSLLVRPKEDSTDV
mmetsp:Transcript_7376/g.21758  ORF Transcript_7376/g.21758 Transcript_7376/m.21758 type:complete len:273 (-) Transcript_7376:111-929(-)|eukprot:CAMPEP_0113533900 /NCGR_PEP_ID=MMETSP0015_2-20120614/4870_1 /TAXON_ID=2838 /ORGANISM="Odontella" /LENGTH=272 /DNA_ID=CAMNT_0000433021 /DNA_START=193 /DNA_END=1011 /DNA_ORIENTATION=+ /assembly_acc=CAM_ASM_000160